MKKLLFAILTSSILTCQAQESKFNLGFENQKDTSKLSDGWIQWGKHNVSIDEDAYSGKKSGKITSVETEKFGCIAYKIPANYNGKTIKLEGYMKIKDVKDGYAGLLLRIDGNGQALELNNMRRFQLNGTKEWIKYNITLDYPEEAETIYIGGILSGKGEAWFDDFVVTIDGKDLQTLKEGKKITTKAKLDKEFDKGSNIQLGNLTQQKIENLELLGRVWGFLKYHHPEIAKGNYNWDYELFRFLPNYLQTANKTQRDELLINWIESLGKTTPCTTCKPTSKDAVLKPDFRWIDAQADALKNTLYTVYKHRSQGKHYYIAMRSGVGNPEFKNENAYTRMAFPDDGFRLLSLYRYWNMIHYFFPYKHLTDKDWNTTLREYLPRFINAKTELDYEFDAVELIGDIQDTHANLWGGNDKMRDWKGQNYAPVRVQFVENQLVITDYYNPEMQSDVGLKIGDVITKINGVSIEKIIQERAKYYPASNEPTRLRDISLDILRSNAQNIEIEYFSTDAQKKTKSLKLYPQDQLDYYYWFRKTDETSYKILDNNIGYVTLGSIKNGDAEKIREAFKNTNGIIIDIRNYPSAFVPFTLGSYFISSDTPFVKFTSGNVNNPGEFTFGNDLKLRKLGDTYKGKVIVLVNELTQSSAEYHSMAFRAGNNTTIVGSTTAGADGNVSVIMLPGGLRTMISGIGVNYPNGQETQRVGIIPDIVSKPTIEGVRNGEDEVLDKAIELILKQIKLKKPFKD